ncbi:right-handed parallel beta-helix repeat-containing protein [Glaciihabitans sp. UYNi722]|uniref:right-handed parallel beta-helix repeat-containing protein n=1 Tax=Glaciihabitans sp. UYNi722 TaxID=3156344 RepID=UPI0033934955
MAFDELKAYTLKPVVPGVPSPSGSPTSTPTAPPTPTNPEPTNPEPTKPTTPPVPGNAITYSSLVANNSLTATLGQVPVGKEVHFKAGTYSATDFDTNKIAIFPLPNVRGIVGAGSGKTLFQLVPHSSTKAASVPSQSTAPVGTNQLYLMRVGGYGPNGEGLPANVPVHLADFSLVGTEQGHLYNGLMLHYADNSVIEGMKVQGIPGDNNANPGETFGIGLYRSNNVTIDGTEIDGRNASGIRNSASLIGINMLDGFTIKNSYLHDAKFGAAVTAYHSTGTLVYENSRFEDNNVSGLNFEGNDSDIRITDCSFARTPWAHIILDAINFGASSKVTITDPLVEGKPVSASNKLRITSHATPGQRQLHSDVHLFVNGVEHPEFIEWQRQNVGEVAGK